MGKLLALKKAKTIGDAVPDGWKTVAEWAEEEGKSVSHIGRVLADLSKSGDVEKQVFRVKNSDRLQSISYFRICEK